MKRKNKGISNILSYITITIVALIIAFSIYSIAFQQTKIGQQIISSEQRRAEEQLEEKISILYWGADGVLVVNNGDKAVKIVKAYVDSNIIPLNEIVNPKEDKLINIPYGENLMLELSSGAIVKFIRFEPSITEPLITETQSETSQQTSQESSLENFYLTRTYTIEYLTTTVFPISFNTIYFRENTITVNGLTAYMLGNPQTNTEKRSNELYREWSGYGKDPEACLGIRIWKRSKEGIETEITSGSPIAIIKHQSNYDSGIYSKSATWNCPAINLPKDSSIVIRVYGYVGPKNDPHTWTELAVFSTPQLQASLQASTWTIYYYYWVYLYYSSTIGWGNGKIQFIWGTPNRNSRIENFNSYVILTTSTYPTTTQTTITKTPNENITLTIYTTTPILTYSYRTTTFPTLTSYSTSFSTSYSTYLTTSKSTTSYFTVTGWVRKTYTFTVTRTSTITYTYTYTFYYNTTQTFASPYISTKTYKTTITIDPIIENSSSFWIVIGLLSFIIVYAITFNYYLIKSMKKDETQEIMRKIEGVKNENK
ncbi:MAG: hypothetical protein QXK24_05365 [Ignisphaera sp.]